MIACYCRVSTEEQSLDRQLSATTSYTQERLGAELADVEIYQDKSTGTSTSRKGYREMMGEYDITLIGATREGLFQQLLFGAIPEAVGQRAENTVIMTKQGLGIASRLKRWFNRRKD